MKMFNYKKIKLSIQRIGHINIKRYRRVRHAASANTTNATDPVAATLSESMVPITTGFDYSQSTTTLSSSQPTASSGPFPPTDRTPPPPVPTKPVEPQGSTESALPTPSLPASSAADSRPPQPTAKSLCLQSTPRSRSSSPQTTATFSPSHSTTTFGSSPLTNFSVCSPEPTQSTEPPTPTEPQKLAPQLAVNPEAISEMSSSMGSRACSTEPMPSTKPTRTGVYGDKYKGDEEEASTISWGGGSYDTSKNFSGHGHSGRLDAGDNQFRDGPCNGNSGEAHAGGGISSRNGGLVLPGATGTFSISKTTTSSGTSATTGYPQHFNHGQKSHNQHQLHQPVNHNQLPHRQLHNYTHSQHHQYYSRHPQQANSHQHQPLSVHRQYPRPHDHQHGHRQQHHSSQQQTRQGYQQQLHRPHATNHQQGFLLNPTNKRFQPYIHPRHNSYMRQQQHHLHPNHSHYKHHQPIQHYHNQQLDMPRNSTHGRSQQLHYHSTHHNQQQHLRHSHHQQHQQPIHHNHSQQHHVHESRHTDECGPLGGSPIETPSPEHYHQVHQRHNDNPFNNDKYHFHFLRNQKTYNHFVHQLQLVHDAQQQYQQQYQPLSTEQLMEKHTNAQYTAIIGQFIHNPKQKGAQRLQQKRHLDNDNDLGRANKRHHHE